MSVIPMPVRGTPRTVLGPVTCQGCGGVVVYERLRVIRLGWLHENGEYACPRTITRKLDERRA